MLLPSGQVYVAYYSDSQNLQRPDIKALTLSVAPPSTLPAASIHVLSQFAPGVATHALNLDLTRYALEFRFRSNPTPGEASFRSCFRGRPLYCLRAWSTGNCHPPTLAIRLRNQESFQTRNSCRF